MEESEFTIKGKTIKVPASVRVASLVGLQRHARFGITENNAPRVTKACLEIITSKEPREEITRSVHHWMKCMAARVLAHQHGKALPTDIQSALTGLIADNQMGLEDRCCAAEILDHISYAKAAALDGTDAVLTLGKLAQDVLEEDLSQFLGRANAKTLSDDDKIEDALRKVVRQSANDEIGKKPEVTVIVSRLN